MRKVIEKCKQLYNKETPLKIEWIMFGIIAFVMLISFYYIDFRSLTIWSTNIWDCIADGDIRQYYVYTGLNIYDVPHQFASGPLFNVIIWAIWNLPIWLVQRFMGKPIIKNAFLLLWSKLFLVIVLGITLYFTYKICKQLFKDNKKSIWITFLAATSIFTYVGVFYSGQTDILICMFAILGLYFLTKERNIWFYVFSSLAISIKYFFLIPYIPIILLTEKNIWKIIAKVGIGILPVLIFTLLVKGFPLYSISENNYFSNLILKGLFGGITLAHNITVSLFILSYIVVCFIAYMIKPKTMEERNNYIIYFSVIPFMLMFMFSTYYEYYRLILLMPVLMILYGFKPELFRINVILDTILSIFYLLVFPLCDSHMFSASFSMNTTLPTKILGIKQVSDISLNQFYTELINNDMLVLIESFCFTGIFASLAIMIIINYPKLNIKKQERQNPEKLERWIIWMRSLIVVPVLMFLLINIK